MVALGRPGAGETLLQDAGFTDVERIDIPFVFEFADPELYARALASTGPAFEAMEAVGEAAFLQAAADWLARRSAPVSPFGHPSRSWATSPSKAARQAPPATTMRRCVQSDESSRASSLRQDRRLKPNNCSMTTARASATWRTCHGCGRTCRRL